MLPSIIYLLTPDAVPQGSRTDEIRALIRRKRAQIMDDTVAARVGAATSKAGNQYAKATDAAAGAAAAAADAAFAKSADTWSESRLKAFLDARGVPVPQNSNTDQLRALVRKHAHKAASGWNAWTFDDLSYDNLRNYLASTGNDAAKKVAEKSDAARSDLVNAANSYYESASKAGGKQYATATSYLSKITQSAKDNFFDTWSDSEIKAYLDSYGIVRIKKILKSFQSFQPVLTNTLTACAPGLDNKRAARIRTPTGHVLPLWHIITLWHIIRQGL